MEKIFMSVYLVPSALPAARKGPRKWRRLAPSGDRHRAERPDLASCDTSCGRAIEMMGFVDA